MAVSRTVGISLVLVLLIIGTIILGRYVDIDVLFLFEELLDRVRALGWFGPVALGVVHIICVIVCFPGTVFVEMGAGLVFGFAGGLMTISISKTIAAAMTFQLGRTYFHEWVSKSVASHPKARMLVARASQDGWKLVVLMRLSPFPSYISNYGFALTDMPFSHYFTASAVLMVPMIAQNVYLGSMVTKIEEIIAGKASASGSLLKNVPIFGGVLLGLYITRVVYQTMNAKVDEKKEDEKKVDEKKEK